MKFGDPVMGLFGFLLVCCLIWEAVRFRMWQSRRRAGCRCEDPFPCYQLGSMEGCQYCRTGIREL